MFLALGSIGVANADGQLSLLPSQTGLSWEQLPTGDCPGFEPGDNQVVWDFVLTSATNVTDATLTATFDAAGQLGPRAFDARGGSAINWYVTTGPDTVVDAVVDFTGTLGASHLVISHVCVGQMGGGGGGAGAGSTPVGTNVAVVPDGAADPNAMLVTFDTVTVEGNTSVTTGDTGPDLPAGLQAGDPPMYWDIQTTASYTGNVTVCFSYAGQTPAPTSLLHFEDGTWVDITSSTDTVNAVICGITTSLSPFVGVHLTPPIVSVPADIAAVASGPDGAVVNFSATASDYAGTTLTASCGPVSGSIFPIGTTTVTCAAIDGRGASASASFNVVVGYGFVGFGKPLNDPITASNAMSVFKRGTVVVVRFSLNYSTGLLVDDSTASSLAAHCAATISFSQTQGAAPAIDEAASTASPSTGTCFRYDSSAHQFVFNLGTKGMPAPATYVLQASVVASDLTIVTVHSLAIGLR